MKTSKASIYAEEMAAMVNSVTDAAIDMDEAVKTISETSASLQKLVDNSGKTTRQFRT
jgi:uncharacterized protein Yka (UPF0111/DUF47 family)